VQARGCGGGTGGAGRDWGSQMLISKVGLSYDREGFIG